MDVLLIDSLEISNVSNALTGLQSQKARDRDAGGLKQPKHTSRSFCFAFWNRIGTEDLDQAISEVIGTFDGVEEISVGLKRL